MWIGRPIAEPDEDNPEPVAVLSHRFWLRRFGGEPNAIGHTIHLNGIAATIVGVTPPEFFGLDRGVESQRNDAVPHW